MKLKSSKHSSSKSTILTFLFVFVSTLGSIVAAEECKGPYVRSDLFGGKSGNEFSDNLTETVRLTRLSIKHGRVIDAIEASWVTSDGKTITGARHGGSGGSESVITLQEGEYINRIQGRAGAYIDQLMFYTNLDHQYGPFGGDGGNPFAIENICVGGFFGRGGRLLDAIGVFSASATERKTKTGTETETGPSCSENGWRWNNACWYTAPNPGMSCNQVCAEKGGFNAEGSKHVGNEVGKHFWPQKQDGKNGVTIECSSTADSPYGPNTNFGANGGVPNGNLSDPSCYVNCACNN